MALRTLLAIMRMFWPDGCVGALEIDRKSHRFWNKCINEFLRYYTFDQRFASEAEARASILAHMRDNLRRILADDRERADYWVSEEFKKKSAAGKKARQAVKVPHTSGARSFDRRRRDYMEAHHGKLDELAVYKKCHTLKDEERKGEWITEDAQKIIGHALNCTRLAELISWLGKAPAAENDGSDDGLGNGESTDSDDDRDMSAPSYDVVSQGGPVIRG
ncbi:hypothetical protein POM88_053927 [Heracleum sosnowskyi]|uniref:Uncharacterized protein n=1 Tax=Heracleum sosnowskyi TaxID=360622 RepID=A0AAD8GN85_9APIA|nr:hypothetical protein POM88_053927 [Heracleum sosnowskyi]